MRSESSFKKWVKEYRKMTIEGLELMWPNETLVRIFKGNYVPNLKKNYKNKKVIEIGFGSGNNLWFLGTLGLDLYGIEVHQEIIDAARSKLERLGYRATLKVGTNRNIPFGDNKFDFLVSWNVLHYENSEKKILEALKEYRRILKPGGRFFISTTGPKHKILLGSETLGKHLYRIKREDDFRKGEIFFYFDAPNYITFYFSKYFSNIMIGRVHDFLFTNILDWFIITGIKK